MKLSDLTPIGNFIRDMARPFETYVVTVGFVAGMFLKVQFEVLTVAASLLGVHAYLRSQDKKNGVGRDDQAAQPDQSPTPPA